MWSLSLCSAEYKTFYLCLMTQITQQFVDGTINNRVQLQKLNRAKHKTTTTK